VHSEQFVFLSYLLHADNDASPSDGVVADYRKVLEDLKVKIFPSLRQATSTLAKKLSHREGTLNESFLVRIPLLALLAKFMVVVSRVRGMLKWYSCPQVLVSSPLYNIFPWESILSTKLVRTMTGLHAAISDRLLREPMGSPRTYSSDSFRKSRNQESVVKFFGVFSSQAMERTVDEESARRSWTIWSAISELSVANQPVRYLKLFKNLAVESNLQGSNSRSYSFGIVCCASISLVPTIHLRA
jgi:hypothetical protein